MFGVNQAISFIINSPRPPKSRHVVPPAWKGAERERKVPRASRGSAHQALYMFRAQRRCDSLRKRLRRGMRKGESVMLEQPAELRENEFKLVLTSRRHVSARPGRQSTDTNESRPVMPVELQADLQRVRQVYVEYNDKMEIEMPVAKI